MRALSDLDLLEVWEAGLHQHPLERALILLERTSPDQPPSNLAALPLGEINRRLLRLHSQLFGPHLEGTVACPKCGTHLEFSSDASSFQSPSPTETSPRSIHVDAPPWHVEARLSTWADLAAAARGDQVSDARRLLVNRCVTAAKRGDAPILAPTELPDEIIDRLAGALAAADPDAEILLRMNCHDCHHAWDSALDPVDFLWTRLASQAKTLLLDVHTLAGAYGWSERDILGLGPVRRQAYLEMVALA